MVVLSRFALAMVLALSFVASLATQALANPLMQPHKAAYEMTLSSVEPNSRVVHATGHFAFEWADACEAWTTSQTAVLEIGHNDGSVFDFAWSYNAWESKDGARLRYSVVRRYGDGTKEEVRGEARLLPGKGGVAHFSLPEDRDLDLPEGTIFPSQQTLEMLKILKSGETPPWRVLFDGSGEDGLFGVSSALARAMEDDEAVGFSSPLTKGHRSWKMHLAFFNLDEAGALPEQEQSFRLFDNGVADELIFDYGDFSVRANLVEIEPLPSGGC